MSEEHLPAIINPPAPAELRRELALAEGYAASALAPSTRRAYERDWLVFATWCAERGAQAIPAAPASVAAFLASEADRGFRPVTIGRRAAAIAAAHRAQDRPNPCDSGAVAAVMSGIRRQHGTRPLRRAAPLELDPLARLLEPIDASTLAGRRDRAMLLLGFAAALRRSELVALDVEDLEFDTARGLKIVIRGSKTDQERAGATVAVPYAGARDRCAVRALQAWLAAAAIHRGPVFRQMRRGDTLTDRRLSDQSVALIVKRRAQAAGLPPRSSPGTRYAPATQPPRRPPASRSARSPTSPATGTSPSYVATSAPRPHSTTSARCCSCRCSRSRASPVSQRSAPALGRGPQAPGRRSISVLRRVGIRFPPVTFLEVAEAVLRAAKRPLTAREITDIALQRGLLRTSGKTPEATMSAALYGAPTDAPIRREFVPGQQAALSAESRRAGCART